MTWREKLKEALDAVPPPIGPHRRVTEGEIQAAYDYLRRSVLENAAMALIGGSVTMPFWSAGGRTWLMCGERGYVEIDVEFFFIAGGGTQ